MIFTRVLLLLVLFSCAYGHKMVKGDKKHHEHNVGIMGGHKISIEEVPYMVSLRLNNGTYQCGGSIVHKKFILSAAHCIYDDERLMTNKEFKVRVGTDKLNKGGKQYDVKKIIIHEQYNNKLYELGYDVCLLKLYEPLSFGPTVNKVLLHSKMGNLKEGTLLKTTGWGTTDPLATVYSDDLQQVSVTVASREECKQINPHTDTVLCAGEPGKDSCGGDSGGPLTWKNMQVGITSFGYGCGIVPGLYTKISVVKPWILEIIKRHHKKEKSGQNTNIQKRQESEKENSSITKKISKRTLQ